MAYLKTFFLMAGLMALFLFVGSYFGEQGLLLALVLGSLMNLGAYWFSHKIVLRMNRAQPVTEEQAPELFRIVRELATQAGIPMPGVYLIDMPTPNAFATGRNPSHAVVAVSPSLLESLNRDELRGVLAHELSHIIHRDILIVTLASCVAGAITYLAHMARWGAIFGGFSSRDDDRGGNPIGLLAMMIVAPLAALVIQLAISRSREYEADAGAAALTGKPMALASALKKIHAFALRRPVEVAPSTASLYIQNPLTGRNLMALFSTHPPIEERIAKLEAMALGGYSFAA